jgi:hypothetical protein
MKLLLAILPILLGCQPPEDDSHWRRTYDIPPETSLPLLGNWHRSATDQIEIRSDVFFCEGKETSITEIQQKYIQLDYPACQFGTAIFWRCPPPYDVLTLNTSDVYYRQQ